MEFEEQLASERECFEEDDNLEKESVTSEQDKTLPVIDLFLNPSRMAEKEEMLNKAHREEAGMAHNKVREKFIFLTLVSFLGAVCKSLSQHLPPAVEVNPALLPVPLLGDLLLHAHVEAVPVGGEGGQLL